MAEENKKGNEMNFEKALERLEKIVSEMEAGKLGLEDMLARFEEGMKLVDFCGKKLNEVKRRIEMLTQREGKETAEDFEVESGEGEG